MAMIIMKKWNSEFTGQCVKQKNIAVQDLWVLDSISEYHYIKERDIVCEDCSQEQGVLVMIRLQRRGGIRAFIFL